MLVRYCIFFYFLCEYKFVFWNCFGGGKMILDFIVNRWLGVNGFNELGLWMFVMVRGWLLIIVVVLYIKVFNILLLRWDL